MFSTEQMVQLVVPEQLDHSFFVVGAAVHVWHYLQTSFMHRNLQHSLELALQAPRLATDVPTNEVSSSILPARVSSSKVTERPERGTTAQFDVFAGACCRTLAQTFIHPLDTVKTRLQVLPSSTGLPVFAGSFLEPRVALAGVRNLYLGLSGAVLGTLPTAVIYFATYETVKRSLGDRSPGVVHLCAAASGACVSSFVKVPMDVLKHRVQAYFYANIGEAAKTILRKDGVPGLYKGFRATMLRDVPETILQFTVYQYLQNFFFPHGATCSGSKSRSSLLIGAAAGAVASTVTTPLDVIKTYMQCSPEAGRRGFLPCTLSILKHQGLKGLFAGMGPRVLQTTLMSAVFFACYAAFEQSREPTSMKVRLPPSIVETSTRLQFEAA